MLYTVYKITNLLDGKYYFGYHKTEDLDDHYLGSGTIIQRSVAKYGRNSFRRDTLFVYLDKESALAKEDELIAVVLGDPFCMNLKRGGAAGWDGEQHPERCERLRQLNKGEGNPQFGTRWVTHSIFGERKVRVADVSNWVATGWVPGRNIKGKPNHKNRGKAPNKGKPHSEESKRKLSESAKTRVGSKNPSFGRACVYNPITNKRKRVAPDDARHWLEQGWILGAGKFSSGDNIRKSKMGLKLMSNPASDECKMIKAGEVDCHLNQGWKLGRK